MDSLTIITSFGRALWTLRGMYDQHQDNKCEIEELQKFLDNYGTQLPRLFKDIGQCRERNDGKTAALNAMQDQMSQALQQLTEWSSYTGRGRFFGQLSSSDRMRDLQKLHRNVMHSVQTNLSLAELYLVIDTKKEMRSLITHQTKQICETTEQMLKNAFNDALGSISLQTAREVKDVAIEARNNSTHVDEKFWEDILGSIDRKILNSHDGDMYEDPLTCELFIDPVVASNGETYCRWTLIDKKVSKNPFDQTEALTILCDNLEKRRHLLREFPAQFEIFQRRRKDFRDHALAMAREGVWLADAIVGLEHVLKWDKKDKECKEALDQVRNLALQETTRQQQPVAVTWSYEQLYPVDYSPAQTARVHFGTGPSSSNVGSWHQDTPQHRPINRGVVRQIGPHITRDHRCSLCNVYADDQSWEMHCQGRRHRRNMDNFATCWQ